MSDFVPASTVPDNPAPDNQGDPPVPVSGVAEYEGSPLEVRVSQLEERVTALETSSKPVAPATWSVASSTRSVTPFDAQARATQLQEQGLSESDAVEQAAYEERLWNDRNNPAG